MRPDVLFIHPSDRYENYQALGHLHTTIDTPVWCGMLAEYTRRKGRGVEIIDMDASELSPEQVGKMTYEINPRLVVVVVYGQHPSASTQNMTAARKVTSIIKAQSAIPVLFVGGHVASLPEYTLENESCDFTCSGEGIYTMIPLLEALGTEVFDKVPDLWYKKEGKSYKSSVIAPLMKSMDEEMPTLAWDILPVDRYRAPYWHTNYRDPRQPYASIYTSLGCPYKCSFCCINSPFMSGKIQMGYKPEVNPYRLWKPETVLNTLDVLVNKYGVKHLKIADEMFVLNRKHVETICKGIIERGYDLNMWSYARVDTTNPDILDLMKKAGMNYLAFGIEAASEKVRDDVQKGYDQDDIRTCLNRVKQAGINCGNNFIFGLPEDDMETMQETLDLACELNGEYSNFYVVQFYPGSNLYIHGKHSTDWREYAQYSVYTKAQDTKHINGREVLAFRDYAFRHYFGRPEYLSYIEKRFGVEARKNIEHTLKIELVRHFA